jgi:DNA polymerase-2
VWLGREHTQADAARIGRGLVQHVNHWWSDHLQREFGLQSALELQFETHYRRFLMPTIRGSQEGSKKRYAGLVKRDNGSEQLVFKGLETVRSDWTPLAQQFQQQLYLRVFQRQPHQDWVRDFVRRTLAGDMDELLVYRKRLRRDLQDYQRNVPPHVRAARMADENDKRLGRALQYQGSSRTRISYVMTTSGPQPLEMRRAPIDYHHYIERQLQPVADAILPFVQDDFTKLIDPNPSLF